MLYRGYIGIMEEKMEAAGIIRGLYGLYMGFIGIMEKKTETFRLNHGFRIFNLVVYALLLRGGLN